MEVIGVLHFIGEEQQVSPTFKKRECVVKSSEQYPQFISINFVQDKCDLLDGYSVGQNVKVHINLRGREWTNPEGVVKYFNDIQGWRLEIADGATQNTATTQTNPQSNQSNTFVDDDAESELPF
jgi:translation initiation factor IF-3